MGSDIDWDALEEGMDQSPPTFTVSVLNDLDLITRRDEIMAELLSRKEAINPTTDTGRDLHSMRAACLIELRRRGLR